MRVRESRVGPSNTEQPTPLPNSQADSSPIWWLRWVPTIVISSLILYFLYVVGRVAIVPVLASFGLAYLLNPIAHQAEKRGVSRSVASLGAIALVGLVIAGFLSYVVPELWFQTSKAVAKISENFTPENAVHQRALLKRYSRPLERVAGDRIETFLSDPSAFLGAATTTLTSSTTDPETGLVQQSWLMATLTSSVDLLLVPFFVFYILVDFQRWRASWEELIPPRFREPFSRLFDESGRILEAYVLGQLLIGTIMACCYAVAFFLLGIPAWAGISAIAGLLNAVPYVGTVLGIILASSFTLAAGKGVWGVAAVLGVFGGVQALEGYVLTPRILGGRLNLHPMAVFLSLLIGGKLFGLWGVILAIPLMAIAKVFLHFLKELYQGSEFYHAGQSDPLSAPQPNIEERLAEAADVVLADQVSQNDDALLETDESDPDSPPSGDQEAD